MFRVSQFFTFMTICILLVLFACRDDVSKHNGDMAVWTLSVACGVAIGAIMMKAHYVVWASGKRATGGKEGADAVLAEVGIPLEMAAQERMPDSLRLVSKDDAIIFDDDFNAVLDLVLAFYYDDPMYYQTMLERVEKARQPWLCSVCNHPNEPSDECSHCGAERIMTDEEEGAV